MATCPADMLLYKHDVTQAEKKKKILWIGKVHVFFTLHGL